MIRLASLLAERDCDTGRVAAICSLAPQVLPCVAGSHSGLRHLHCSITPPLSRPVYDELFLQQRVGETLEETFKSFAGGTAMDGRAFMKCLNDSGLLDKGMAAADADLFFMKYRPKGGRKINFITFRQALTAVATARGVPQAAVVQMVCDAGRPVYESGITPRPDG